jgi:hypothetical protein
MDLAIDIIPGEEEISLMSGLTEYSSLQAGETRWQESHSRRVIGRDDQIYKLQTAFGRVSSAPLELILIHAPAGVGKTFLVHGALPQVAVGKFEQYYQLPFAVVSCALEEVVEQVLVSEKRQEIADALKATLSADQLPLLMPLIGNLSHLLSSDQYQDIYSVRGYQASKGFHKVCQTFVRTVAMHMPLVIMFDDLQWADAESLAVINALLNDCDSRRVLWIGAHREDSKSEKFLAFLKQEFVLSTTVKTVNPRSFSPSSNRNFFSQPPICHYSICPLSKPPCLLHLY